MDRKERIVYFAKKSAFFGISLFALSLFTFYVSRFAPGDPLISYYGEQVEKMSPERREWAEEKLGLRDPVPVQYFQWLKNVFRGDFGISYKYKMDVTGVLKGRIGNTVILGGTGFLLIFGLAILIGIACAWHEDSLPDRMLCKLGTLSSCIPEFWLSLVLILIFSVNLKLLPSSGAYDMGKEGNVGNRILHLILPVTVVVTGHLWYYAHMVRNMLLKEMQADYVLLARAKGLRKGSVMVRHCLQNALPSYLSIMAISVPHILGGTYVVEMVFSYPGLGTLFYESARYKDYNLLMVMCLISGSLVILGNMAAQAINEKLDSRT